MPAPTDASLPAPRADAAQRTPPTQALSRLALLFPVAVVAAAALGRAISNLALVAMLGFAVYLLFRGRVRPPGWLWPIPAYLAVLALGTLLYGVDVAQGMEYWLRLALAMAATLVVSFSARATGPLDNGGARIFLLLSAVSLAAYALRAAYLYGIDDWRPAALLNGLHVAALLPLALIALRDRPRWFAGYTLLTLAVLVIGDSRSEVLMLLLGVAAMLLFYRGRLGWLLAAVPLAFFLAVVYGALFRGYTGLGSQGLFGVFEVFTGGRAGLWLMALDHPPQNPMLGAGCGQSEHYFQLHHYITNSFHNAFIETWYDAGWLGLGLLLLGLSRLARPIADNYRRLDGHERWIYAGYFGALIAALCACLADRGYMTVLFNVYLFHCLVILNRFNADRPAVGGN